jgi:hypothetical protein
MSNNSWYQTLITAQGAGTALTAAAAATMLPGQAKFTFPANQLKVGDKLGINAQGIISCAVTTPGTARFDVRFGSTVVFDTGALNLNIVAKVNVPWFLDIELTVRSVGASTAATLWGQGKFTSEAVVGSPLPSAGGNGVLNVPVSGLAVSTGFDSTTSFTIDSFFTQTVATGSLTLQEYELVYKT